MAKNILQDIVPPEKRSIRNIPIPAKNTASRNIIADVNPPVREPVARGNFEIPKVPRRPVVEPAPLDTEDDEPRIYPYESDTDQKGGFFSSHKKLIWGAGVLAVLIILFSVASLFSGATVTVVPKEETVAATPETVFTAKAEATGDELGFQVLKITKNAGKEVPATGEEKVERKATGTIIIYNSADKTSQRLIKNTRFETPTGLIYRVSESVVVPAVKTEAGKVIPGSVEAVVYADEAGDKYNIGKVDFTIPGFKNDPRYKTLYARSKTEMSGGFVGTVKKISATDEKKARTELDAQLQDTLKKEALAQAPADFTLYDDGIFYSYNALPQTGDSKSSATVNEEATITAILFNNRAFAGAVASKLAPNVSKTQVAIVGAENLKLAIKDKQLLSPNSLDTISFTLAGTLNFVSKFDEEKLKGDLAGKSKKDLTGILQLYPSIKSASAVLRPFWKGSFPSNVSDIKIVIAPESH